MRCCLLAVIVTVCCTSAYAQNFDKYETLLPQGIIPKDFTEQSSSKVAAEVTNISEKKNRIVKAKKKFVLESTFGIDDFLASGSVLFNDDVSLYLDAVLKELLKPYPDLQKKIRVYAVKSSSVNAFTTNDGMIFVNLGLLSRLENEAQLAFVLAHEVVHYQKKHVINAYVTNVEIERSKGDYRKLSVGEKGFARSSYKKELESEADLDGAELYAKSSYAKDSVELVFDILKLADFPATSTVFGKQLFESGSYIFPDALTLTHVKPIDVDEDYDDSKRSHPSIKKRKDAIFEKFKGQTGGAHFTVSKTRFFNTKKIAQYELCRLYLLEHRYAECFALALDLRAENASSTYLNETTAKALYGIAKQSLSDEGLKLSDEKWLGEAERLSRFIEGQSSYELSVLAIRELYKARELNPANEEISLMVNDMLQSFGEKHNGAIKNFLRTSSDKELPKLKYAYTQHAFLDFKDSKGFFQVFEKNIAKKPVAKISKKKKKTKIKREPLGIEKIVVVNPMYKKIDTRKKQQMRHTDAEEVLININEKILAAASELGMKTDIVNPNKLTSSQVTLMQSNSIMNDWLDEQMRSADNKMVSPIYNEVIAMADKHKTDHFAWMGGITMRHHARGVPFVVLSAIIMPATAPLSVAHIVAPKGRTLYFALVFNVRKQELEFVDLRQMMTKDSESLLQSNIYYTLFKLKK